MARRMWFMSDLHFSHTNVLHLSNREFANIQQMEQTIINNINKVVKADDVFYLLGDVCLGKKEAWRAFLDALVCKNIVLVIGNHDKWGNIPKDKVLGIFDSVRLKMLGMTLLLSHYPYRVGFWRALYLQYAPWLRFNIRHLDSLRSKKRPKDTGLWLLHGHTHAKTQLVDYHPRMLNVGVDSNNYKPISGEDIVSIIQRTETERKKAKCSIDFLAY